MLVFCLLLATAAAATACLIVFGVGRIETQNLSNLEERNEDKQHYREVNAGNSALF